MKNRIQQVREERKISLAKLSRLTNIPIQQLKDWEEELEEPSLKDWICLSDALNVTLDYLVKGRKCLLKNTIIENYKDIKNNFKLNNQTDGFIFGKYKNALISNKDNEVIGNSLIIGRTGSGKTRAVIRPNLLQSIKRFNSVIVNDPFAELYLDFSDKFKESNYKVYLLDFNNNKEDCIKWDILSIFKDIDGNLDDIFFEEYIKSFYENMLLFDRDFNELEFLLFKNIIKEAVISNIKINELISISQKEIKKNNSVNYLNSIAKTNDLELYSIEDLSNTFEEMIKVLNMFLSKNELGEMLSGNDSFNIYNIFNKKTIYFISYNLKEISIANRIISFIYDSLIYKMYTNKIKKSIDIYLDEFMYFSGSMKNINMLLEDVRKKYNKKVMVSMFFQTTVHIENYVLEQTKNKELISFVDLFDNVILLGTTSYDDIVFFADYFGFYETPHMVLEDIEKMNLKDLVICRNNKVLKIEKIYV